VTDGGDMTTLENGANGTIVKWIVTALLAKMPRSNTAATRGFLVE